MAGRQAVCTTSWEQRGDMICSQCGALLLEDRFLEWTARWRCLKCGHVQDSVTVHSYLARQEKGFLLKSAEPDYWDEEVHLGSESFVDPDVTSQYVGKRRWL